LVGQPRNVSHHESAEHNFLNQAVHGRKFDEVFDEQKRVPYKIVKAANGDAHVQVEVNGTQTFSPPEISAMICRSCAPMQSEARRKNYAAVITVPAYFNDSQRNATKTQAKSRPRSFAHHQ